MRTFFYENDQREVHISLHTADGKRVCRLGFPTHDDAERVFEIDFSNFLENNTHPQLTSEEIESCREMLINNRP
jgi:hypothetical protein